MSRFFEIRNPSLLRQQRRQIKFSQEKIADKVGLSKPYISLLERGRNKITRENALKLADILNLSLSDIIDASTIDVCDEPRWLRNVARVHGLNETDKKQLLYFAKSSGMPEFLPGENETEYRSRWLRFYEEVQGFLSEPIDKFFCDQKVQYMLSRLGVAGTKDWSIIKAAFISLIDDRCGTGDGCQNLMDWCNRVCERLRIKVIDLAEADEYRDYAAADRQVIELKKAVVRSSDRIYGAIGALNPSRSGYAFVCDSGSCRGNCGNYPFWHEAARVMVDENLSTGHVASYIADGMAITPIESLLARMTIWLAFNFKAGRARLQKMSTEGNVSAEEIKKANRAIFQGSTLRMTSMALVESMPNAAAYIDAQRRIREVECRCAKISIDDLAGMSEHPNAKLRIGYVFKNSVAECQGVGLRYNMRIGEGSVINKAWREKSALRGKEAFSLWPGKYGLLGAYEAIACYSHKKKNVRAFLIFDM